MLGDIFPRSTPSACMCVESWLAHGLSIHVLVIGQSDYFGVGFTTLYSVESALFTITAEIHARSLVNFYRQYADRHMNLKFMRRVSEQEREIRQFVIVKNKLMSVFNTSVLLLTTNFVITLSKLLWIHEAIHSYFDNVMTKFMINNRTDA